MDDRTTAAAIDLSFPLGGPALPLDHRQALADAVAEAMPWVRDEPGTAVFLAHLVHGSAASPAGEVLLSARSRLVIRTRRSRVDDASALAGQTLQVGGWAVRVGPARPRELLPHGTLYAHFVASEQAGEPAFLDGMRAALDRLDASRCHPVCGRHQRVRGTDGVIDGYSLMLHGLSPRASLRVLEQGLGAHRLMGCGVFVPHKSAAAVGED